MSSLSISGLASGLDTDAIVQKMMAVEHSPQTSLRLQQSQSQVRRDALRDVKTRLVNVQSAVRDLRSVGLWADTQSAASTDSSRVAVRRTGMVPPGGYQVEVTRLARAEQRTYAYAPQDSDTQLTIGESSVTVGANSDLSTVVAAINSSTSMAVYATAITDPGSGGQRLVLSSRATGASNGFTASAAGLTEDADRHMAGVDAMFKVDGVEHASATNTVAGAIAGLDLTFTGTTNGFAVSVNVASAKPDLEAIKAKVRAFVEQYNSTMQFISGKLSEKRVPNPQNATDAARGVLQSDGTLRSLLSQLRMTISTTKLDNQQTSGVSTLADVGVSTGAATGSGGLNQDSVSGKLALDESKLSAALDSHPSAVRSLFANPDSGGGFARSVEALVDPITQAGGVLEGRIAGEDTKQRRISDTLTDLDRKLQQKQSRLKAQFTAMETALASTQSQSQWLAGQIATLSDSRRY